MIGTGIKVRCIDKKDEVFNKNFYYITIGKEYKVKGLVYKQLKTFISIINDADELFNYPINLFEEVVEKKEEEKKIEEETQLFKIGDKVKCIRMGSNIYLTIGKEYIIKKIVNDNKEIVIENDDKFNSYYDIKLFKSTTFIEEIQHSLDLIKDYKGKINDALRDIEHERTYIEVLIQRQNDTPKQ